MPFAAVFCNKVEPNYGQPWQMCPQKASTGSAFVITPARRQILTNNHVVDNATTIFVRRPGIPKKCESLCHTWSLLGELLLPAILINDCFCG